MPSRTPALRHMRDKVATDFEPMGARLVDALPRDGVLRLEPKPPGHGQRGDERRLASLIGSDQIVCEGRLGLQ